MKKFHKKRYSKYIIMPTQMNIQDQRIGALFVLGLLLSLLFNIILDPSVMFSTLSLIGYESYPLYGVIIWDLDLNECHYYESNEHFPSGFNQMIDNSAKDCGDIEVSMIEERLERINNTTDSAEVKALIKEAEDEKEDTNFEKFKELNSKITSEKTYYVDNNTR